MRNNIPIIGESKPTLAGQPIIRIEIRIGAAGDFIPEVLLIEGGSGAATFQKTTLKPEATPDCALLAAHLAIIRKLSQPPKE